MVQITTNYIFRWGYKPTNITGGAHPVWRWIDYSHPAHMRKRKEYLESTKIWWNCINPVHSPSSSDGKRWGHQMYAAKIPICSWLTFLTPKKFSFMVNLWSNNNGHLLLCCFGAIFRQESHHPIEGQLPEIFLPGGVVPELPLEPFSGLLSWFRMGKKRRNIGSNWGKNLSYNLKMMEIITYNLVVGGFNPSETY